MERKGLFATPSVNLEDERLYSSKPVDFPVDSANDIPIVGDIPNLSNTCYTGYPDDPYYGNNACSGTFMYDGLEIYNEAGTQIADVVWDEDLVNHIPFGTPQPPP